MEEQTAKVVGQFTAGFLKPDTRIVCVRILRGYPEAAHEHLSRVSPTPAGELNRISDFVGLVEINSASAALEFVRLRTSLTTCIMLNKNLPIELEIVPTSILKCLPTYGLMAGITPFYDRYNEFGCNGIISNAGFRQGHFRLPIVSSVKGGFVVRRWTLTQILDFKHRKTIRYTNYIQESVTTNGRYERKMIHQQSPPTLPYTRWMIPGLA